MEPKFLYHYTSIQTLFKLIDGLEPENAPKDAERNDLSFYNLKLWGSNILYMNDPTENIFYVECLKKALIRYEKRNGLPGKSHILQSFKTFFDDWGDTFIVSLCEDPESLSMWRMYGANGCGVAIGLSLSDLEETMNTKKIYRISNIDYYTEEELIDNFADNLLKFIYDSVRELPDNMLGARDPRVTNAILPPNTFIKPKPYQDEKEWRLYASPAIQTGFRERNGLIIPYFQFDIPLTAVKHIIIGPCAEQALLVKSLTKMLRSKLLGINKTERDQIEIQVSNLPYVIR